MLISNIPSNFTAVQGIGGNTPVSGVTKIPLPPAGTDFDYVLIRPLGTGSLWLTDNGVTPADGTGRPYKQDTGDLIFHKSDLPYVQTAGVDIDNIFVTYYTVNK